MNVHCLGSLLSFRLYSPSALVGDTTRYIAQQLQGKSCASPGLSNQKPSDLHYQQLLIWLCQSVTDTSPRPAVNGVPVIAPDTAQLARAYVVHGISSVLIPPGGLAAVQAYCSSAGEKTKSYA
jgi:hypothetical protein